MASIWRQGYVSAQLQMPAKRTEKGNPLLTQLFQLLDQAAQEQPYIRNDADRFQ